MDDRSFAAEHQLALHELQQRYKREWDRAERLQDELDAIKNSRAYRIFTWWQHLLSKWRGSRRPVTFPSPTFIPENLESLSAVTTGRVSILIPFKDRLDLLKPCVRSIRRSSYRDREIVLLDNGSTCPDLLRYVRRGRGAKAFRVLECPGPFNFSAICNSGARAATGEFVLFLNNDTEVLTEDWIERMLQLANHPTIGVVGATLFYPDGSLQHAGIERQDDGQWRHAHHGLPREEIGKKGEILVSRTVPAVTAACLLIRRSLFLEMGGFDEQLGVTFNDVELCLRSWRRNLKVAVTPHARLLHFECMSRGYARDQLSEKVSNTTW